MYERKYKILMLATSMQYGGAETHILELARYLKANGCEVKIASNAKAEDLFAQEIEKSGIEHIFCEPFSSRSIIAVRKSKRLLKKILSEFAPDIVHAHARIPAFIASGVCKRFKTPLVTTMHGAYKNTPLLRFLTNWGDYSLYVSDDIKDYWEQQNDHIKASHMTKTVNGINTALFNPQASCRDIRNELGIAPGEKIILSVSRLDAESSYAAVKLCEIAEDIYENHKHKNDKNDGGTRIVIVGDGTIFDDIRASADKVNEKLGFDYIIMTGRRADTYNFYAECSVFVNISRSVLEALACAKPVIMCGDYGWAGRFTRENAERCEATNFTCRGFGYPDDVNAALLNEITFCLNNTNNTNDIDDIDAISEDCKYGAELVYDKYSVKKMADDAYSVYQKAELRYKDYDFVLSGYYGYNNIGDDALLFSILSSIFKLKNNLKVCVLTKNPRKIQKKLDGRFANTVAEPRFNLLTVRNAIKKSRALVFGGGTLLQDSTSSRSLRYYLWLIKTARRYNKKTMLYANGIGPLHYGEDKVRQLIDYISLATIRDEDSYKYLLELGMDKSKVHLTADEAVMIEDYRDIVGGSDTNSQERAEFMTGDYIVVSVRKWQGLGVEFFEGFSAAVDSICREHNLSPVYIVMCPGQDKAVSQRLADSNRRAYVADIGGDIGKILEIIASAKAVIAMRLHALIFASAFGAPMIGVSYNPKVSSFLEQIYGNDNFTIELDRFDKDTLVEKFRVLLSNSEELSHEISLKAQESRVLAEQNARLLLEELEDTENAANIGN